ncbi:MAG: Pr6Pr family membrane protein [Propionibacteriaceae bacterium]|jgi:hypothetical protein|nr:Pr6Pr family membrane protein [Propionibacteriaceae bacterium]
MRDPNRRRSELAGGLVAALYSLYLCLVLADTFAACARNDAPDAPPAWAFLYYFTDQANLLFLAWLIGFAVVMLGGPARRPRLTRLVLNRSVATGVTLYLTLVFLVVVTLIEPFYTGDFNPTPWGAGLWVHAVSPLLCFAFYLLAPLRGRATWRSLAPWLGYLVVYVAVTDIVGATVTWPEGRSTYPYPFLDPTRYPWPAYALILVALAAATWGLGLALNALKTRFDQAATVPVTPAATRHPAESRQPAARPAD